jgi:hypothetical protein
MRDIRPLRRVPGDAVPDRNDPLDACARGASAPDRHNIAGCVGGLTGSRRTQACGGFSSLGAEHAAAAGHIPASPRILKSVAEDSCLAGGECQLNVSTENPCVRHKFSPDTGTRQAASASLRLPDDSGAFALDDAAPAQLIASATDDAVPAHMVAEALGSERALGSMLCYLAFIAAVLLGAGDWLARLFVAWWWS